MKPPLGIQDEHRQKELYEAIHRYIHINKIPPKEWFDELKKLKL